MSPFIIPVVAYVMGSIPFGYLIVRATQGTDIRQIGSRGTGATNVSRSAGRLAGVLTLVLDAAKGAVAILFAKWILGAPQLEISWWIAAAAVAVIIGHIFPVWLRFHGGKGVATAIGVFLVLAPFTVMFAAVFFVAIVWITRYVSLGSMVAAITIPILVWLQHVLIRPVHNVSALLTAALIAAGLIVFAHRANIQRLIRGTENKFQLKQP